MKKHYPSIILYLLFTPVIILFHSCSPRVTTYDSVYIPDYNPSLVDYSAEQTIVKKKDLFGLNVEYRGAIMIDEPATYWKRADCNEEVAMNRLRMESAQAGASLINIVEEIKPGETVLPYQRSACYRCRAEFYKTDMDSITQRILKQPERITTFLTDSDTITWRSFMKTDSTYVPLKYFVNLFVRAGNVSLWTGRHSDFEVAPVFYNDISKVNSSFATEDNLTVLHQLAKIAKYHSEKAAFQLNDKSEREKSGSIKEIHENNVLNMQKDIEAFLKETDYGRDQKAVEKWNKAE